ncbi:hypothetical protein GOP47_0010148 [Adiantum capillus-veneris]|uniref:Uncharacterized protein n=1 Tax=Adiantum capillus-veneris TaxID=13818 RepID=A0A9D4UVF7_ADICA|nr:hypothetical protein GOP47_0010148 [Adiantum capillus-veneris]
MAASCGSLTSDEASRRTLRWPRRATARAARAAARARAHAAAGSQEPARYRHYTRENVKRRRGCRSHTSQVKKRVMRKAPTLWPPAQAIELSKFVLGFKLNNGRLPVGADKLFWAACINSFHGCLTHQQLRRKVRGLKQRYINISCGLAKNIRLGERDVFDIWSLIMQPEPPALRHAVATQYNCNQAPFLHAQPPPSHVNVPPASCSAHAECGAVPTAPDCNRGEIVVDDNNVVPVNIQSSQAGKQHESEGYGQWATELKVGTSAPTAAVARNGQNIAGECGRLDKSIPDGDGTVVDNHDAAAAASATASESESASTCSQMQYSCCKGELGDDDRGQQHKMNSNVPDDDCHSPGCRNAQENYVRFGGRRRCYKEYYATGCNCNYDSGGNQKSSSQRDATIATIAELATATKVLAEATLSSNSTTGILARTTQTLAHILVSDFQFPY